MNDKELISRAINLIEQTKGDDCPWCGRNCWSGSSHYPGCVAVAFLNDASALQKAPIAQGQPAATEQAKQDGRGPLGCADVLGADHQPERKP